MAFGRPELGPFFLVGRVDVGCEVLGPFYAGGLGVADVGDVVYVAFGGESEGEDRWLMGCVAIYPS